MTGDTAVAGTVPAVNFIFIQSDTLSIKHVLRYLFFSLAETKELVKWLEMKHEKPVLWFT